ncbi:MULTISPECIES: helix-turn-helix domain-containing protein [Bacillus cereus group]|uniref:helix-turn-helix domain-containing protein n=1 Tax=Bacillus cereus group TaxID=86661 RepID=UPI000BF19178|nr:MULTISPECIES: helix-turn-helix transcriptional regulator [Bacillus cereus group]PEM38472.1 transcriptional regulator [Bacillus toyonensis]PEU31778.1 transcriptional regulator [Bacillus wiedmannii]PHD64329.1 transcriptional regulator [Bacillus toyonensis]
MNAATIRFTRQLLDLTQTEFGALVGVNQLAVTRWESDLQSPNKDSVRRIRTLLGDEVLAKIDVFMYEQELKVLKDSVKAQVAARATVKKKDGSTKVGVAVCVR